VINEIERVKGREFKYESFLWMQINAIRNLERAGNYPAALDGAVSLIPYLPRVFKKQFQDEANEINRTMRKIEAEATGAYAFNRSINKNRTLQIYSRKVYPSFIDRVTTLLDDRGYMEKVFRIPTRRYKKESV